MIQTDALSRQVILRSDWTAEQHPSAVRRQAISWWELSNQG